MTSSAYWQGVGDDRANVLIIGIDFGTTFSGAAWATPYDFEQEQINLIHTWPGMGQEKGKAPTELFYDDDQIYWGYEIPPDADPVQWFKLLLLRDEDLGDELRTSEYVQRGRRMLRDTGKTATDLVADYLRLLWAHVLETICRDRGDAAVDGMRLQIVLTVPAIWKGYARQRMEDAAAQAGLLAARAAGATELSFVTEPEAAALATLYNSPTPSKQGDVFIICDAGGGTVDLISYCVTRGAPVVMEEAVEGTGGLFGSLFLDQAFEEMARRRLGPKWANLTKTGVKELVRGEWQQAIKPQYKHVDHSKRNYTVRIPAEAFASKAEMTDLAKDPPIRMGRFCLTGAQIEGLFDYVLAGIDALIDNQIRAVRRHKNLPVSDIILVGGLGASPYLYQHLKARHAAAKINVLQSTGTKPWTAICRGAVYKGFYRALNADAGVPGSVPATATNDNDDGDGNDDNDSRLRLEPPIQIASTVSRFSVGLSFSQVFHEARHALDDRYWDEKEEVYFARHQMEWYLRKGASVKTLEPIRHDFYLLFDGPKTEWVRELYLCNDADPPARKADNVIKLCDIRCNFASIADSLPDYTSPNGTVYKRFAYEVVMIPTGASVDFQVFYKGQRLASQEVKVCFD